MFSTHTRIYIYIHIIYVYIWIIVIWRYVRCFTRGLPKFLELLRTLTFPKALNSARSRVFCPNLSPMRIRNGHVHIKNVDDIEIDLRKSKLVLVPNGLRVWIFLFLRKKFFSCIYKKITITLERKLL